MVHQEQKKEASMYIRISEHEKAKWTTIAEGENMTFSEWVRWVIRKEVERKEAKDNAA